MPTSPSFSVRSRPNYRRRRTIALLVLLGIVVIVVALLSRSGTIGKNEPTPQLAFTTKITHLNQDSKKAADAGKQAAQAEAITTMVTDYYQEAFVDAEKWGDGKFEDLKGLFSEAAQASFAKDIESLTIGQGRTDLKRVEPSASDLAITIYYDARSEPTFAVAAATFNATGTLKKTGPAVTIKQKATFYLQKSGDDWTITAYDADQTQESRTPSPTASPS